MAQPTNFSQFGTENQREVWSDSLFVQSDIESHIGKLKGMTGLPNAIGIPGVRGAHATFTVPTHSKLDKDVLPANVRAMDNPSKLYWDASSGQMYVFRKSAVVRYPDESVNPLSLIAAHLHELGNWWALMQDLYGVHELSVGRETLDDEPATTSYATDALKIAQYTSQFTTLTNFKAIVNTAAVGTGTSVYNVWFPDSTEDSGLMRSPANGTWNGMGETNLLTPRVFEVLPAKLINRGCRPARFSIDGVDTYGWHVLGTPNSLAMILGSTEWKDHVMYADVRGENNRYFKGEDQRKVVIKNKFVFTPLNHPMYGLDNDTAIRTEDVGDDGKMSREELLILGAGAFAFSEYDQSRPVISVQLFDGGYEYHTILTMIYGMTKLQYVLNDGSRRDTTASLCCTVRL